MPSTGGPVQRDVEDTATENAAAWWKSAVFYQIYPRSFSDAGGTGVGDLAGIRDRLGYLELLGVDALWICPVMRSPMADGGYDVSDPRDIDPLFGDLETFDQVVAEAHDRGMRVTMDLVPNHTSDRHPWFTAATAAAPGSSERARYIFRDGRGPDGAEPPNNWPSVFGGPAWTRVTESDGTPGQWYLHLFAPQQPDLNWDNPEVVADFEHTVRFWLERGVDGFRIDVAHGMAKPPGLPDIDPTVLAAIEASGEPPGTAREDAEPPARDGRDPRFDNPGVHDVHRRLRKVLDEYPGAVSIGEVWVEDNARFGDYLRSDELHLAFNFRLAEAAFDAADIRAAVQNSLESVHSVGAAATWTLSNHDIAREVTRYGGGATGLARARAMMMFELALPGTVFVYNGAELGLPNVDDLPESALRDPVWERSGHRDRGRDGCRVPIPWEGERPPFGFTDGQPWLPMPEQWADRTVEQQLEHLESTLSLYRSALELRSTRDEFAGDTIEWRDGPGDCPGFRRPGGLVCVLNTSTAAIDLPAGELLLTSAPLHEAQLAPGAAAWVADTVARS
ncbi:glycoside hydrolase family 13 protein [Nocardia vermiculata]|uniref:Glycoside hydrolase family 13 protein n=1 Tax=Nocardia vermiculata TaxID=257274 RepID=A0A846XUV9_9NOCA|nr:glycoside hydrolase family 13 protein [Nocardia vermiculata]NKY49181.1 glycoside hydrolase family 13 protein [Nocardia vermiculata]